MNRVINIALAEVGYKESGTNITKYSDDFDKNYPDFYNTKKQGAEWCDIFVDWCMVKAYGVEAAHKLLCQPKKSAGAGVIYSYGYYKKNNQVGSEPRVGAQAFFGSNQKSLHHTGLVIEVNGDRVKTIEGNAGNEVKIKEYNARDIYGFGYPDYSIIPHQNEPTEAPSGNTTIYKVVKGDTLSGIASRLGSTVGAILASNPSITNPDIISIGQEIIIPETKAATVAPAPSVIKARVNTVRDPLRIREQPNTNCSVLGLLPKGTIIEIESINGGWAKLKGRSGYVASSLIVLI